MYAANRPGPHLMYVAPRGLPPGPLPVTVYIYDDQKRFITAITNSVLVSRVAPKIKNELGGATTN